MLHDVEVAATYVAGSALLSCGMAIASGASGMGAARLLELWRRPEMPGETGTVAIRPSAGGE